ncbi:hypothetical protein ACRYWZ_13125 [Agrobacterium deltaense]
MNAIVFLKPHGVARLDSIRHGQSWARRSVNHSNRTGRSFIAALTHRRFA